MASKQQMRQAPGESIEEIGDQSIGPAALASMASVALSWYYFFVRGDRQRGLFVGLWPPTILAFASYFNQRRMRKQIETVTQPGTTLKKTFDSMMGNR